MGGYPRPVDLFMIFTPPKEIKGGSRGQNSEICHGIWGIGVWKKDVIYLFIFYLNKHLQPWVKLFSTKYVFSCQ